MAKKKLKSPTYNQALGEYKRKRGRPPTFETAEQLAQAFEDYKAFVDANPFEIVTIFKGEESVRHIPHPYTLCGFMVFIDSMSEWCDWKRYTKERGADFLGVLTRIETEVRDQQVNGGMAGMYNANLTARLNGLTDKKDVTSKGEKIDFKFEIVDGESE